MGSEMCIRDRKLSINTSNPSKINVVLAREPSLAMIFVGTCGLAETGLLAGSVSVFIIPTESPAVGSGRVFSGCLHAVNTRSSR